MIATKIELPSPEQIAGLVKRTACRNWLWERIQYQPHKAQRRVHSAIACGAKNVSVFAGTRSGKTKLAASEATTEMMFEPPPNASERLIRISAPYHELTDKAWNWVWYWVVERQALGVAPRRKSDVQRYIEMPWGARIIGASMDNPDSSLGDACCMNICDEFALFGAEIYDKYIERSLVDYDGISICITTPLGFNHANTRHEEWRAMMKESSHYYCDRFTSYDNPYLPAGAIDKVRARMERRGQLLLFRQEYLAEPLALAGGVYPMFSEVRHVRDRVDYMPEIPVFLGIDFGFRAPTAVMFMQLVGGDRIRIFDEIYQSGLAPSQLAKRIRAKLELYGVDPGNEDQFDLAYHDPSGAGNAAELESHGIPCSSKTAAGTKLNDIAEGLAIVRELMTREAEPGSNEELEPGIIIDGERCPNAIRELHVYKYSDKLVTDNPEKRDDHAPDAIRYGAMGVLGGSEEDWGL